MRESLDSLLQYLTFTYVYVKHTEYRLNLYEDYIEWSFKLDCGDILFDIDPKKDRFERIYIYDYIIKWEQFDEYMLYIGSEYGIYRNTKLTDKLKAFLKCFDDSYLNLNPNLRENTITYIKNSLQNKLISEAKLFANYQESCLIINEIKSHFKKIWEIDLELEYKESTKLDFMPYDRLYKNIRELHEYSFYFFDFLDLYGKEELDNYIYNDNISDTGISEPINNHSSFIKLKADVTPKVFRNIYDIFVDNDIIDREEVEEDSFVAALTKFDTKITFLCSTPIAVNLIEEIKVLFVRFNATMMEKSDIFYTKNGCPLKSTNYNKAKTQLIKMNESDLIKLNKIKKKLKPIILSAIK